MQRLMTCLLLMTLGPAAPAAEELPKVTLPLAQSALARHDRDIKQAEAAYRAAMKQARQSCLDSLDASMKIALRAGRLDEAKAIEASIIHLKADTAVPGAAPRPVAPAALPTIGLAEVKVAAPKTTWGTLKVGNAVFSDKHHLWVTVPAKLAGRTFTSFPRHQGSLDFEVVTAGKVIMAVTQDWVKSEEHTTRAALLAAGWKEENEQPLVPDETTPFIHYFSRQCKVGEKFHIKTAKYTAPILIK